MPYEKARLIKIEDRVEPETGEIKRYAHLDLFTQVRVQLRDPDVISAYEPLVGKTILVPIAQGEYQGKIYWRLTGDFKPIG